MNPLLASKVWRPMALILVFVGFGMAAPAASKPWKSREARRLLWEIRMDARQIRSHAYRWDMLTKSQNATWYKYDRQWRAIKPAVQDMSAKLSRLDQIESTLPRREQDAILASRPLAANIAGDSIDLRAAIGESYKDVYDISSTTFQKDSQALARDAGRLIRTLS